MQTQLMRGRAAWHIIGLWMLALSLLVWTSPLYAHASLTASTPQAGEVLPTAPRSVTLSFNESVSPLVMRLIHPDGSTQALNEAQAQNQNVELALPALQAEGSYGVSWRVISADGHPVGGTLMFSIGAPSTTALDGENTHPLRNGVIWLSRLLGYLGLFIGIGWTLYKAKIHTVGGLYVQQRHYAWTALAVAALALLLNLGLVGVDALDLAPSALLTGTVWTTAAATSMGVAVMLGWASLACAAGSWLSKRTSGQAWLATAAVFILGASLSASGHASTATPAWLSRPAVWLHVVALTLWIGSLLPLAFALKQQQESRLLAHFSRLIPMALIALTLSGATLIYVQFDQLSSLWESAYGQILSIKLILVALLLGLGAYNRYHLTAAVLNQHSPARHTMSRTIKLEMVLVVLILALVALWRFTPPPRALATVNTPAIATHVHTEAGMADLVYTPAHSNQAAHLSLSLFEPDFSPLKAQEVEVIFANPQAGVEAISYPASEDTQGQWQVGPIDLPNLPSWNIRIQVLISDFERIHLDSTLDLHKP